MTGFAQGAPCWTDAMVSDVEAGKRFYGELLGWTFGGSDPDRHEYTMAFLDGKPVGALFAKADGRMPTVWNVYFAVPDAEAAAARIREAGGQVFMGPDPIVDLGTMLMAADPTGGVFGLWQGRRHQGFGERDRPGTFCWTELNTRDPEAADPFYRAVFGYRTEQIGKSGGDFDYEVWSPGDADGGAPVGGRMRMGEDFPAELPAHFTVLFSVADCDAAVERVRELGGRVVSKPQDSPYGRLAAVTDDQGTHFTVIDLSRSAR